jgi:hypothetical protein
VWSVTQDYLSVVRYSGIECCNVGEMVQELYQGSNRIYASEPMAAPFYPDGIVLSADGSEGLFPENGRIERRSVPSIKPLSTCEQQARNNVSAQYVHGGNGSYVWVSFGRSISGKSYDEAEVHLCLIGRS